MTLHCSVKDQKWQISRPFYKMIKREARRIMKNRTKAVIGILAVLAIAGLFLYRKIHHDIDKIVLRGLDR